MELGIRKIKADDRAHLLNLYAKVAECNIGIARNVNEIDDAFILDIMSVNTKGGLGFVGLVGKDIIGEVHASKYGIEIFDHVLSDLTICIHPDFQGQSYGKKIFSYFLNEIENTRPDILRVELESRASNKKSIELYKSIGFIQEGILKNKTRNVDGSFEDSILFSWLNKKFQ
jgi:putative acetyltransferase